LTSSWCVGGLGVAQCRASRTIMRSRRPSHIDMHATLAGRSIWRERTSARWGRSAKKFARMQWWAVGVLDNAEATCAEELEVELLRVLACTPVASVAEHGWQVIVGMTARCSCAEGKPYCMGNPWVRTVTVGCRGPGGTGSARRASVARISTRRAFMRGEA
jgi:hypothetical protein